MKEEKRKSFELFAELAKHNRYFEGLFDAVFEFLENEAKGIAFTCEKFKSKFESVETLYRDEKKTGQVLYKYLLEKKPDYEDEDSPVIKDGKLLVPMVASEPRSIKIEYLEQVVEFEEDVPGKINEIVLSFAQIMSKLMEHQLDIKLEAFQGYFPNPETLYLLSLIAEAFKK